MGSTRPRTSGVGVASPPTICAVPCDGALCGLQLVEPVQSPGRSRPPHGSHHQPTPPAAWRGAANPPCRSNDPDHHQCPRVGWKGSGRIDADCRFLCRASVNCGAVDDRTAMVPDPQPSPRSLPEWEPSAPSATPCSNLTPARTTRAKVENPRRPIDSLPLNCRI